YLYSAERTAEVFIPDPFAEEPGARLYKTGDLARYLQNGNIEFLGRLDHQVKVHGFRIELGEIEAALADHPALRESLDVTHEEPRGGKRLVAYIVPQPPYSPTGSEIRSFLKQRLPKYMVPSGFVILEKLPLTSNGKIDRQALPAPDHIRPELDETFVPPR